MSERSGIPLGLCILPQPRRNASRSVKYPDYLREVLAHLGICCDEWSLEELPAALSSLRMLITVGEHELSDTQKDALSVWVAAGGVWLSIAGVCGMEAVLGAEAERPTYVGWAGGICSVGEGYLTPAPSLFPDPAQAPPIPLHFFGGLAVRATTGEARGGILNMHQHPTERAGVVDNQFGKGRTRLIALDLPGTLVRIQQGVAITRDGIPAPDGTAPINDSVLKSDDGAVLDWVFDRQAIMGVPGLSGFLHPIADFWRELLLHSLLDMAAFAGVAVPLLWLYPEDRPAIGHISHDTDGNTPAEAQQLLTTLAEANIHSTWCVIEPGYAPELIAAIREAGHELAMHFDSISDGRPWSLTEFSRQWEFLTALFDGEHPVSNKNHLLRWEGDTEFFDWCIQHGIQIDQSKGTSKTGEAGYNFGTCHPYFPCAPDGTPLDVLELPTPTQDIGVFAPPALLIPLREATLRHHGVLHLLFHPAHIFKPGVADALKGIVMETVEAGMVWWTAAELNRWERARRAVRWKAYTIEGDRASVVLDTPEPLPGASVLWSLPTAVPAGAHCVTRWGRRFISVPNQGDRTEILLSGELGQG